MKVYIKQNRFLNNQDITQQEANELIADGFLEIELDDKYVDCSFLDFDNWKMFNIQKYNDRKAKQKNEMYVHRVEELIRQRYSASDELALLRQKDTKPGEFNTYYEFVEQAKLQAKNEASEGEIL